MDQPPSKRTDPKWLVDLVGASELGTLVAEHDWSATPLGHPSTWPPALASAVEVCLRSAFPMLVTWGPELIQIYNDGYRPILGEDKHPIALGAPAREIWSEIWDTIGPSFEVALAGGTVWEEHQRLEIDRNGFLEECFFTYSYSPLPDGHGGVGGVLDVVTETTESVVAGGGSSASARWRPSWSPPTPSPRCAGGRSPPCGPAPTTCSRPRCTSGPATSPCGWPPAGARSSRRSTTTSSTSSAPALPAACWAPTGRPAARPHLGRVRSGRREPMA